VIVNAGGKPTLTLADLAAALEEAGVGNTVTLTLRRGDAEREVKLRVIDLAG
jgi:2-alkenal reductase